MSLTARQHGARGVVIDGGTRDLEGILAIEHWAAFSRYTTPIESHRRWRPEEFQVPIFVSGTTTSEVVVRPGDFILGDHDAVLVIPAEIAADVTERAERLEVQEEGTRRDLAAGVPIDEVCRRYQRL